MLLFFIGLAGGYIFGTIIYRIISRILLRRRVRKSWRKIVRDIKEQGHDPKNLLNEQIKF